MYRPTHQGALPGLRRARHNHHGQHGLQGLDPGLGQSWKMVDGVHITHEAGDYHPRSSVGKEREGPFGPLSLERLFLEAVCRLREVGSAGTRQGAGAPSHPLS
jgi:hypothetical protein